MARESKDPTPHRNLPFHILRGIQEVSNTTNQWNNSDLLEQIMREHCQKVPV